MDQASALDPTSDECGKMQREGLALCECPPAPAEAGTGTCTLCQGGAPFNASVEFIQDFGCGTIATYASGDTRPNACQAYQSTIGLYCGCPYDAAVADDAPVCTLCGGGKFLPEPGRFVEKPGGQDKNACANLEFEATRVYDTCDNDTATYSEACCKPTAKGAPALGDVVLIEDGGTSGGDSNVTAPQDDEEDEEDEEKEDGATSSDACCASLGRIHCVIAAAAAFLLTLTLLP